MKAVAILLLVALVSGCRSTQGVGMMTRNRVSAEKLLETALEYEDLGRVRGQACRFFVLAVIPFGDSTSVAAMEKALDKVGGDALINAYVTTSLYGFVPIYNVLSFTCTTVTGTAIDLEW